VGRLRSVVVVASVALDRATDVLHMISRDPEVQRVHYSEERTFIILAESSCALSVWCLPDGSGG
jgi:hypothetical protein